MKIIFVMTCTLSIVISACGVKSRPLPPLEPTPLGRGQPRISKSPEGFIEKKRKLDDDFDESEDFNTNEKE